LVVEEALVTEEVREIVDLCELIFVDLVVVEFSISVVVSCVETGKALVFEAFPGTDRVVVELFDGVVVKREFVVIIFEVVADASAVVAFLVANVVVGETRIF